MAHGEVIKAAADLVKSLAVSLSTWGDAVQLNLGGEGGGHEETENPRHRWLRLLVVEAVPVPDAVG